jgi:SAM-dependent methyltransferase
LATIDDVRAFWDANPLWTGESRHPTGSLAFFEEHRDVYRRDCFAGEIDARVWPLPSNLDIVLDLGCGPGFWTVELARQGARRVVAADISSRALGLARRRCEMYGVTATFRQENAESLSFNDGEFSHVNCQGVIHHTPDTAACIREIARVLRPGGTAVVSVYHRNLILRAWPAVRPVAWAVSALGGGLRGRGREGMLRLRNANDLVRCYDGVQNPIAKAFSRAELREMLAPHFHIQDMFLHFFPARAIPGRMPALVHRLLDRRLGFLLFARLTKAE